MGDWVLTGHVQLHITFAARRGLHGRVSKRANAAQRPAHAGFLPSRTWEVYDGPAGGRGLCHDNAGLRRICEIFWSLL